MSSCNDSKYAGQRATGQRGGPTATPAPAARAIRRVRSEDLLGEAGELAIVHGEREYRLRVTSNGKLILTA